MSVDNKNNDIFSLRKVDDFAILSLRKGAKQILTTVDSKEKLISVLQAVSESGEYKGLAIHHSAKYPGNEEYKKFIGAVLDEERRADKSRYKITYESAIIQFLGIIRVFPLPIVGAMDGEIGPDSLGLSLALDLRIASKNAVFFNPNLEFGFPPSSVLSYYMVKNYGPTRATELLLTQKKISAQEALELSLVTEVVSAADLEKSCLEKLQELCSIPPQTIIETRRILQPNMDEIKGKIDAGFQGTARSYYRLET